MLSNIFFLENRAVYEKMWKNIVGRGRPQMTQYGACALHAGYLSLQTHTHNIQDVSGGIVNILGGGSMEYSE